MAVYGEHTCYKCYKEFTGCASARGRAICHVCVKKEHIRIIKNIQKEAGCDKKMAEYLYKMKEASKPNIMI